MHLRLKWDKVLLVLIVHFARYDVGDIHYCGKTRRGEYSMVVTDEHVKGISVAAGESNPRQCWVFFNKYQLRQRWNYDVKSMVKSSQF